MGIQRIESCLKRYESIFKQNRDLDANKNPKQMPKSSKKKFLLNFITLLNS